MAGSSTSEPPATELAGGISVVIPVGGFEPRVVDQLRRVSEQQPADLLAEVVVSVNAADRASHDAIDDAIARLADERFRAVDSSDRRGAAHARNVGVRATVSDRIALCDADDAVHDGWLQGISDGLQHADAVSGRVIDVVPNARLRNAIAPARPDGLNTFLGHPYLLTGNMGIWRRAFDAVGGFDETLTRCEDIAISVDLVKSGFTLGFAETAVLDYHHRPGIAAMLRQHFHYGRGMSEVVRRHPIAPAASGSPRLLRANSSIRGTTVLGKLRKAAILTGRLAGLLDPRAR